MTALATQNGHPNALAPRSAEPSAPSWFENLRLDRIHIFQDGPKEASRHGRHEKGTVLLNGVPIPTDTKFVPLLVLYRWTKMKDKLMEYRRTALTDRPPADIAQDCVWGDDNLPKKDRKPKAEFSIEVLCATSISELPVFVRFKSKGLTNGKKFASGVLLYRQMAKVRSKKDPTISPFTTFTLAVAPDSNDDGEWFNPVPNMTGPLLRSDPLFIRVEEFAEAFSELTAEELNRVKDDDEETAPEPVAARPVVAAVAPPDQDIPF